MCVSFQSRVNEITKKYNVHNGGECWDSSWCFSWRKSQWAYKMKIILVRHLSSKPKNSVCRNPIKKGGKEWNKHKLGSTTQRTPRGIWNGYCMKILEQSSISTNMAHVFANLCIMYSVFSFIKAFIKLFQKA